MEQVVESRGVSPKGFLTIRDVAGELSMTTDGVYKLIQRGKLKAVKKSERKTLVPEPALRAYQARLRGEGPPLDLPKPDLSLDEARQEFERETGALPESWLGKWKKDELEDSVVNMRRAIEALSIVIDGSPRSESESTAPDPKMPTYP